MYFLDTTHLALDDVEDRDEAVVVALVSVRRDHHVLGLEQAAHHVEHGCFAHFGLFLLVGEGCVGGGQEVESRRWDEGCDQADQVVVHVAGVAEGRRAG